MKHSRILILSLLLTIVFVLAACGTKAPEPASSSDEAPPAEVESLAELVNIRIAALPVLDTLPIYVAQQEGLFEQYGITVEAIPASSAPKRDELINASQADGMINEVMSTIFHNREETRVQIVRYGRVATADAPAFFILSAKESGIESLEALKGVEIGVSQGTIIEYLTDRLLQAEGFSDEDINTVAVPDIGQRMALLGSGELSAAMLPDPLASLVMQQGAVLVLDDSSHPEYSYSTIAFRKEFTDQHPEAVRGFLAAWEEAVQKINADPQKYADLMVERKLVPPPLVGQFPVPDFVTADIPTQAQWDDAIAWAGEKGIETGQASYAESVTDAYLP